MSPAASVETTNELWLVLLWVRVWTPSEKLKAIGVMLAKNRELPSGAESVMDPVTLSLGARPDSVWTA
jgi:hypothetical protein